MTQIILADAVNAEPAFHGQSQVADGASGLFLGVFGVRPPPTPPKGRRRCRMAGQSAMERFSADDLPSRPG